ncbi:ABC transporter substrate-binding protein [Paracoccus sp. CPCC 101403]|uniref:ABC transporter substrate-binding protein n=1 Tax=Paracoccus broussonetiae TaxID=3075834 RepID=A0ABU3EKY2_9RHOB|nr:ABC transporter substrate-binding protein [Paracoccus sp. CPCC 101403]MDT1064462.1 ABC transporter substrate-binding protein [Paracoccus sp. CPCC 101403]
MSKFRMANLLCGVAIGSVVATGAFAQDDANAITIVTPYAFDNIDACNSSSEVGLVVRENVVEALTHLNPESGKPEPRLATSWEQVEPTVWRIKLREGVTYSDDSAFDADAVSRSIERMFNPKLDCLNRGKLFANIRLTPKVVDSHTIDISTEKPQPLMPIFMSFLTIESPKTDFDAMTSTPVGTGPFAIPQRNAGDAIVLVRQDKYWGEAPAVSKATYVRRDESALRAAMVEVGEADIGLNIAIQDATNPETDHGYLNGETTRLRFSFEGPLADIRVRKAMNLAIDREALRDGLFNQDYAIATQMFLPRINGYNPDMKPWPYDPEQAKALIDEAKKDGVDVGAEIPLISRINFYANGQETMEAMIAMWQMVGLNVKLQPMERAQWLKLVNKPYAEPRPAMLIQEQHDNNSGDATFTMHFRYHSTGQQSEFGDPELDHLIDAADAASGDERVKLFQQANAYSAENVVPDVMMFHMVNYMRISDRLEFKPDGVTSTMMELSQIKFRGTN